MKKKQTKPDIKINVVERMDVIDIIKKGYLLALGVHIYLIVFKVFGVIYDFIGGIL